MEFVAYGVKIHSPVELPLLLPFIGKTDHTLCLNVLNVSGEKSNVLEYHTPTTEIHGRMSRLSSNLPLSLSRTANIQCWKIDIEGLFSFSWCNESNKMSIEYTLHLDLEKVAFWLLHTVLPVYLMLKQSSLFLHASVVEVKKKALIFIAPSFGGKSTLADFFVQQKHLMLSDDKVRIKKKDKEYYVYPSYPYRRPYRKFEVLGDHTKYFSEMVLPLHFIYVLNYVNPNDECSINNVEGLQKFEILKNAYLYEPVSISKIEMQYLMEFSTKCTLFRIDIPKDILKLKSVYMKIIGHIESLGN